jgi:hypothetical protein
MTIHAWSGMGIRDYLGDADIDALTERSYLAKRFAATSVLIIDEISMMHHFRFDMLNRLAQAFKKNSQPFGGMQIILVGDFFQLPPISRQGEQPAQFVYQSEAWRDAGFTICYLQEQYRQKDEISLKILNEIRAGEVSEESYEQLQSCFPAARGNRPYSGPAPTRLFTHNIDVDTLNKRELNKVPGSECEYYMIARGKPNLVEALKKSCLAPEVLQLRPGARVMCVKNNFEAGYVNGTLGVVVSAGVNQPPVIAVETKTGKRHLTIEPAIWRVEEEGKMLAELVQYPLRLAWAITVHKSQGMSLDAVEVDLSRSFEPGMGYVALSRVRTLDGLRILGMNNMALQVHPEVLEFDRELKARSAESQADIEEMAERSRVHVQALQSEFLGKVKPEGKKAKVKVSTVAETAKLVADRMPLKEIAATRGLKIDTIIEHIEKCISTAEGDNQEATLEVSDIQYLKNDISYAHFQKIEKAFEEVVDAALEKDPHATDKPPLLSPVKTKVGANVAFWEIRLARMVLGYVK